MRETGSENKSSSGCTFIDVCCAYKSKVKCNEKKCPLYGGEKRGN